MHRRQGRRRGLGAIGEMVLIIALATLAVVQGSSAAWGIIAGIVEMCGLVLRS